MQIVEDHGLTFIGPTAEHIRLMGDKITAKETMKALGVPCVPGSDGAVPTLEEARKVAAAIGYPVIVKATAGGGGRGMKLARTADDIETAFQTARAEAKAAFGNDEVYLEKYLGAAAPHRGAGLRRRQGRRGAPRRARLLAAAPAPEGARGGALAGDRRRRPARGSAGSAPTRWRKIDYAGAGTIEFLYENGEFYFIEMNTRLQVEHPVTEAIYDVDLVQEQIRVAAGLPMSFTQDELDARRPRDRVPDQRREAAALPALARAGSAPTTRPAASACAWTARSTTATRSRPTTTA